MDTTTALNQLQLNFSPASLQVLNICLGFIMFGIALELKPASFKRVFLQPKVPLTGVFAQFFLLPLLTFLLVLLLQPIPSIALGMMLVAACPGGNISNFFAALAKGNTELSVSLTAIATLLAVVMTPFNFAFWASCYPETAALLQTVQLDIWDMFKTVLTLLALPLVTGMWVGHRFPVFTQRITKTVRILSIVFFIGFVVAAFAANVNSFLQYIHLVIGLVLIHNAVALFSGYSLARLLRFAPKDVKSITIETGIQNSGLGLILIFNFFDGLGGMAIVAAWWGIWHIVAGLSLGFFWSRK